MKGSPLVWCVAWGGWGLTMAAALGALAIGVAIDVELTVLAGHLVGVGFMAGLGAYVVTRRPEILTGWLLLAFSLSAAAGSTGWMVGWLEITEGGIGFSLVQPLLAISFAVWSIPYAVLFLMGLTAPDGALLSPRWRYAVVGVAVMALLWVIAAVAGMFTADDADLEQLLSAQGLADDPGVLDQRVLLLWLLIMPLMGVLLVASVASVALRYQRSEGEERQRVKWVATGLFVALILNLGEVTEASSQPWLLLQDLIPMVAYLALSAGIGFALFRYRLWDIDVVIQRSLVYGTLWLAIAGVYFGLALALGLAASSRVPVWSAVGLTVLATLLFQPARRWLERAADRWVFGRRQEPLKVVYGFGEVLGSVEQASDIAGQLARAATAAAPLTWVRVETAGSAAVEIGGRREEQPVDLPLVYGDETLGKLLCQPLPGCRLSDDERSTLAALATQAAVAISRAQLASRIIRAQEIERRRIERNIHDGAQQELVALVAKLGLARRQNGTLDHARLLADLQDEVRAILANLRELAQGVHPSVLTDGGLAVAVEDRCSRLSIPVRLEIWPELRSARFGEDIEAAAYFAVAEGLANLLRHSRARAASVGLRLDDGHLTVEVADDGAGFDTSSLRVNGGLRGLADRFQALGGELSIESAPGRGTRLCASLPARIAARA